MDMSQHFNQDSELCDVVLHLSTTQPLEDDPEPNSSKKRARSPEPEYARSYFVHAIILYNSPY